MSDISSTGLSAGTYDLRLTPYTSTKIEIVMPQVAAAVTIPGLEQSVSNLDSFTIYRHSAQCWASNSPPSFVIGDLAPSTSTKAVPTGDLAHYDLTTTDLFYTDSDDDNAGVTFTVSNLDSALTLTVNGASQSTFTGTQLNAGQVRFTHSGVEDDSATFDVNVEDGNEDSSAPTDSTFTFTIVDQNDPPVLLVILQPTSTKGVLTTLLPPISSTPTQTTITLA